MKEILRSKDPVLLSFLQARLEGEGVPCVVFDEHASFMDGSIGALPRRVMVADDDEALARTLLREIEEGE